MREREPEAGQDVHQSMPWTNRTTVALVGGLVLLVIIVAYFATNRNPYQDKLSTNEVVATSPRTNEKQCASSATYDLIKRELFRRAAQLRGSDQAAYDNLARYAVVRMDNPVMVSQDSNTRAVNCSGSLSLDLPPGVAVVGGRRTLASDIDYTITTAADGSGTVVLLRNVDAIVTPLATLARMNQRAAQQSAQQTSLNEAQATTNVEAAPLPQQAPVASPQPTPQGPQSARPSFDCANVHSRGEMAVCSDAGLATLDRQMAAQYGRAFAAASPEEKDLLRETAHRFYAFRDRCRDTRCVGDAYTGRMREISDIMDGRWQPPR